MGPTDKTAEKDLKWQQVVTAVAAAAGGAAWVSAVGSGVVALRLREADLPIEPVVALMSVEHRFAIGVGILVLPLFAGFFGCLIDWLVVRKKGNRPNERPGQIGEGSGQDEAARKKDEDRRHRWRQVLAAATVLVGTTLVYFVLKPRFETLAFAGVAVALVVPAALEVLRRGDVDPHGFHEQLAVFLSVLVAAGAGAILAESFGSPPSFDEAEITIRDQSVPVTGGYITSTEHAVVLSTRCEVIEAVPRDQIERITVGPEEVKRTHC